MDAITVESLNCVDHWGAHIKLIWMYTGKCGMAATGMCFLLQWDTERILESGIRKKAHFTWPVTKVSSRRLK